jgi:predicted permease
MDSSLASTADLWPEVLSTFMASLRSVGTACTLAGIGVYLHQQGYVVGNGKRTLALISQQVTIPLLFFTKILYCNQDWSSDPCPNVTESLKDVWVLLLWPLYVCAAGLLVGYVCARYVARVPPSQVNGMLVAIGFGNCTGLPITLLTVIHSNFPSDTHMGRIDPTLFLSVYLILYPILQWGIGGWLLAPPEKEKTGTDKKEDQEEEEDDDNNDDNDGGNITQAEQGIVSASSRSSTHSAQHIVESLKSTARHANHTLAHNVLNRTQKMTYQISHRGLESVDASLYMSVPEKLNKWGRPVSYGTVEGGDGGGDSYDDHVHDHNGAVEEAHPSGSHHSVGMDLSSNTDGGRRGTTDPAALGFGSSLNLIPEGTAAGHHDPIEGGSSETSALLQHKEQHESKQHINPTEVDEASSSGSAEVEEHLCETCLKVVRRCLQPPVVGALLGLFVASFPGLRGIFVDIVDRTGDAPLEWFFDGLYAVGQAAVPLNMMILGCNLSASYMLDSSDSTHKEKFFSPTATASVVVGKMVVMPIIGYVSAYVLNSFYYVPEEIAGSFYLVLLMVFLCPTANNVMVMVELSGSGSREGMARIIAYQYMSAPLILSLTVSIAVFMASRM